MEDQSLYNQITVKNIDNEDFIFNVNREQYMIRASEVRIFPKFMVRPMLKHLIDKILIKRDPEGKLLRNQQLRDELAAKIVLKEETYEKPSLPSDHEIVDSMNKQPELDRILAKNKSSLKGTEPTIISEPTVDTTQIQTPKPKKNGKVKEDLVVTQSQPVNQPVSTEVNEVFDQIESEKSQEGETPKQIPSREKMLTYAQDVLKLDISEPKTKKAWDKMSDKQLFVELDLDKEEDLASLGF